MNKNQVIKALKENLFMLRDREITTITKQARKSLTTSLEAAIKLLEIEDSQSRNYPENLLLDLSIAPAENEKYLYSMLLSKALETLSETEEDLIKKRYLENKEIPEISEETSISESSIEDLISDIKGNLSKEIKNLSENFVLSDESAENNVNTEKLMESLSEKRKFDIAGALSGDIDLLDLSPRSGNALKRAGYMKIGDLNGISEDKLRSIKGLGKSSYNEVIEKAQECGIRIKKK